jgi:hypothetical protein
MPRGKAEEAVPDPPARVEASPVGEA